MQSTRLHVPEAAAPSPPSRLSAAPAPDPPTPRAVASGLRNFVERHPRLFILTGAGISTDSGIPGYRDAGGKWQRSPPVQGPEFLRSEATRRRYWARSMAGWPLLARAEPNAAHRALARLEALDRVQQLVTQNVDGLHQRAGSRSVIELHGNIRHVLCLDCGAECSRESVQRKLEQDNPQFGETTGAAGPDGDAEIDPRAIDAFRVPRCAWCEGMLKPTVVFFGDNVPRDRVDAATHDLELADAMLVVGSSLMVYSGYRFCEWARRMGKPIAAINLGNTRADHLFSLKAEVSCADGLTCVVGG
jgi:NAD-dependent SIR2 family protein deacetylase